MEQYVRDTTGLIIDPYFSGTKMKWILENVPAARELAGKGRLRFGTIDTWLIYSLTDGEAYVTDASNASRTMLFDIHRLRWDEEMLRYFGIPREALPRVAESGEMVGMCSAAVVLGVEIPIAGMAGDQHAALFGQCLLYPGHGQEHLRHRLLRADEHRFQAGGLPARAAHHHRLEAGGAR